jgi:hypothetical protein
MADRFGLEKVRARTGAQPEALPGTRVGRPWAVPAEAVAEALAADPAAGLTAEEVADRLQRFGPNELVEQGRKPGLAAAGRAVATP